MLFYLVCTAKGELVLSPFPEWDKPSLQSKGGSTGIVKVLLPAIPLAYLEQFLAKGSVGVSVGTGGQTERLILKALAGENGLQDFPWHWEEVEEQEGQEEQESLGNQGGQESLGERLPGVEISSEVKEPSAKIAGFLRGRKLTEDELGLFARSYRLKTEEVWRQAHRLVQAGSGEWIPAVRRESKGWRCQRCGESELEEWPSVYGETYTCPSCKSLGACSSLKVIYRDLSSSLGVDSGLRYDNYSLNTGDGIVLTPAQTNAAGQVLEFVHSASDREALLWAACGAGKTEVCFPAAAWALAQGKSVLFAAPRQDVVHDVAPRLRQAFPDLSIPVLSGASDAKFGFGQLILATTHQVLRFYRAFDFIFLDELDAFPYRDSPMLQWGITQALKPGGKILFLSATPDRAVLKRLGTQGKIIRLPARHHRRPLPVPVYEKIPNWSKAKDLDSVAIKMSPRFDNMLAALRQHGPVMFFVPKISWVQAWTAILSRVFPGWRIAGSYSRDPERQDKLAGLRRGDFDLFVATSILERGVTIESAQVVVMAADHPIFDERALVQMAGRAGRTRANPSGEVIFFAARETPAIRTAVRWINEQNELARSAGLLD